MFRLLFSHTQLPFELFLFIEYNRMNLYVPVSGPSKLQGLRNKEETGFLPPVLTDI